MEIAVKVNREEAEEPPAVFRKPSGADRAPHEARPVFRSRSFVQRRLGPKGYTALQGDPVPALTSTIALDN